MAINVILDVDTGIDDMVAIVMATKSKKLDIKGIIATAGNQTLPITLKNTLSVCQQLGQTCPVYRGTATPLVKEPREASHIHGEDGLGGVIFPPLTKEAEKTSGVLFLIDMIRKHPNEITVVATGPLTDIAIAFSIAPDIIPLIHQLVIMGGGIDCGNVTPYAEFNFYYDSEAAQIVFSSQAHIVLVPLNVTSLVRISEKRLEHYEHLNDPVVLMMCSSLRFYQKAYQQNNLKDPILHDAVCIAYLTNPEIFLERPMRVTVYCEMDEYYGKVSVEDDPNSSTIVTTSIDSTAFFALLDELLKN